MDNNKELIDNLNSTDFVKINEDFHNSISQIRKQSMKKQATMSSPLYNTMSNTTRVPLYWQDPLYDSFNLMFPEKNLKEANKRYRHYYNHHPIAGSCVDIHATFPLSDFDIMVDGDPEIKEYYNYISENLELYKIFENELRDKALLGESVFLGNWDALNMEWENWVQYPPELVEIINVPTEKQPYFLIEPDKTIKDIFNSKSEAAQILKNTLSKNNPEYYKALNSGTNYQVTSDRIMYISNRKDGYTQRGISLMGRALQDLMYEDNLRSLQHTFVQRHLFPMKIYKLGCRELNWIPGPQHFQQFKRLLLKACSDPDFSLIYHYGLEVEYVGTKDKIENLIPHFEFTAKRIMNAFFVNDALINGEAPSYAGQTANTRLLMHRFMGNRIDICKEAKMKIFYKIAQFQKLVKQTTGEKSKSIIIKSSKFKKSNYCLPEFLFYKQNLLNSQSERQFLLNLYNDGAIPWGIIRDVFGLDQNIIDRYRKEDQRTLSDRITRETIDQIIKDDSELSLKYVEGEDPLTIVKERLKKQKEIAQNSLKSDNTGMSKDSLDMGAGLNPENFDSSAPIEIPEPTPESGSEETNTNPPGADNEGI